MSTHFPSMASLRAFEAVARLLSFTRAARELNLTQTAISHQIKKLEILMNTKLFIRQNTTVALTDAARDLLISVRPLITEVGLATERARDRKRNKTLYVGCMASFGLYYLLPRLTTFQIENPDIELRVGTVASTADDLDRRDYDVAIRYGYGDWPGFVNERLHDEEIFPVCSPDLIKRGPRLRRPADLGRHVIIRTSSSVVFRDNWSLWLKHAGVADIKFHKELQFDLLFPSVEASFCGLGVAMGRTPLVNEALRKGLLVEPFKIRLRSEAAYFISSPQERAHLETVARFRDWIRLCKQ